MGSVRVSTRRQSLAGKRVRHVLGIHTNEHERKQLKSRMDCNSVLEGGIL